MLIAATAQIHALTVGVEVKAGSAVQNKAPFVGLVLYTGEQVLRFGDQLWAVPMHALWSE